MSMPCESTPRRSVRTISPAVMSARSFGIFMAMSARVMNSVSLVWGTSVGVSAIPFSCSTFERRLCRRLLVLRGGRVEHAVRRARPVGRGAKPPSELQSRDFDSGVLELVAPVHRGQHGGDAFQ